MAVERFTGSQTDTVLSDIDLRDKEFYALKRTATGGTLCVAGDHCDGVISEGKNVGLHSSIKTGNQVKAIAGAAVAVGAKVTPDANGKFITATAGTEVFGTAISIANAANDLFTIDVDRSNADLA
jgi:predicted TIM-barrel enzyme